MPAPRQDVLGRFYTWLLKHYGRQKRTTRVSYVTKVRAFFRFPDRRRWLHPDVSYERMKDGMWCWLRPMSTLLPPPPSGREHDHAPSAVVW